VQDGEVITSFAAIRVWTTIPTTGVHPLAYRSLPQVGFFL